MIDWNKIEKEDMKIIHEISKRAVKEFNVGELLDYTMDVGATHTCGCPLDLQKLLDADKFNFAHDIFGINKNLDRETGELLNCFLPRCALPN